MYKKKSGPQTQRMKWPKEGEVLGVVEQLLGYAKMRVKCADGKIRVCRIPGRLTRHLWIRERDIVLIEPNSNYLESNQSDFSVIVGLLSDLKEDDKDLYKEAWINPMIDFYDVKTAFVIK